MAKVFVSYRSKDQAEAERLFQAIQAAGHDVWMDIHEISIGDSVIGKINAGLRDAEYLVLCFSVHGVDSPWIGAEWMSTLARELGGKNVKILPVRLTGGDPPPILADKKYADLVKNWNDGVKELLKAVK